MMDKLLKNIYTIINNYNNEIKQQYRLEISNNLSDKMIHFRSRIEQKKLDYEVSIFKNIEKKEIQFSELLDVHNDTPYTLNSFETKIFRTYIGMYNNGKIQTLDEISKKFNQPKELIGVIITEILEEMHKPYFQRFLITERNNKKQGNTLKKDISYLTMTDNLEEIFRSMNINKVEDIINMTKRQICLMNIQYGYNAEEILPPTRIIKQIYELGFEMKETEIFDIIFKKYSKENKTKIIDTELQEHATYIDTKLDIISVQQFEPEILNTLDSIERLQLDASINEGFMKNQVLKASEEIMFKLYSTGKTLPKINDILKKEFPYLSQQKINTIENIIKKEYKINNSKTEYEDLIENVYLKEKN